MSDTQPAVQSSSGGESVRQIVTAMQLLQSQKSSGDVFWDPKTNEPMGGKFSHHLGELLPRCSSPVGDDGFPEVNLETTPGIDGDDASGHKRVCIRRSGKCFETLAHAAQEVLPGDEIVLSSGMFYETEDVILDKDNVTISAAKEGEILASVRIIFSADCCLICEGSGVLVSNVTFLQLRNWNGETKSKETARAQGCIRIRDGNAQFKQCSFSSESAPAIVVSGSAHPMIEGSSISGCKKVAILCQGNSYPTFESNKIQNNMGFAISVHDESAAQFLNNTVSNTVKCAVICGGSSTALFQGNTVSDGTQGGFWIQGRSKCVLKDNIIRNNHKAALQISDHSDPHIEGNQILDGDGGGIVVHGNAKGLYIQNKLSGSVRAGIGVMDDACPLFIGNEMVSNQGGGAVMAGNSAPIFIANKLLQNGFVGLGVKEHSTPLLQDNIIVGNVGYGILLQGKSRTEVQGCTVENNRRAGLCACEEAVLRASKCLIQASTEGQQRAGLLMHDDSKAIMEKCTVLGHKTGNVVMQDHSAGSLMENELANGVIGMKMHASASATLRHNTIRDSKECNLLLLNESQIRACYNTVSGARGAGVRAIQSAACSLSHNTIVDNGEAGVRMEDAGWVELRENRVSGNGTDGIHIRSSRAKIKHNVVFGNAEVALALRGNGTSVLVGNTLVAGAAENAQALAVDANINLGGPLCSANTIQATSRAIAALSHAGVVSSNRLVKSADHCWAAVRAGLDALDASAPRQAARVLVQMPDGEMSLGEGSQAKAKKLTVGGGQGKEEAKDKVKESKKKCR